MIGGRTRFRPPHHRKELELSLEAASLSGVEIAFDLNDSDEIWGSELAECDALVLCSRGLPRHAIESAARLKLVQKMGRVAERVDVAACVERGIKVSVVSDISYVAVAEHTIMFVLAAARHLVNGHQAVVAGDNPLGLDRMATAQSRRYPNWLGLDGSSFPVLADSSLGIIGLGEIGREVAVRARCFGMRVFYTQRTRLSAALEKELGVEYLPLSELLAKARFVSLHATHYDEKRPLIGVEELEMMGPQTTFINTARGNQVDQKHLVRMLREGRLGCAALDVFDVEPAVAEDFAGLKNVVLTPHTAAAIAPGRRFREAAENIRAIVNGREIANRVG